MGADQEVKVLPLVVHNEGSEAQGRKGDRPSGGSVERICEPMNKNRIRGDAPWGEQPATCEAAMDNGVWCRSGGCAEKVSVLTWGDLASCLKGRRCKLEREVSSGRSRHPGVGGLKGQTMRHKEQT